MISSKTSILVSSPENDGRNVRDGDMARDTTIADLRRELEERDKQLRIQTQVNTEVKRLLVASVGEDIEAKVDFLTQVRNLENRNSHHLNVS